MTPSTAVLVNLIVLLIVSAYAHGLTIRQKIKKKGCSISIKDGLPSPQPLLLKLGGSSDGGHGFYLPEDSSGEVHVAADAVVHIACSGHNNHFTLLGANISDACAVCISDNTFSVANTSYTFSEFSCKKHPFHTARATGATCNRGTGIQIEIGFIIGKEFIRTVEICFDEGEKKTFWSKFELVAGIGGYQSGFPGTDFIADTFYPGLTPNKLYSRNLQRETLGKILNSTTLAREYISHTDDHFIARGHLTAKADFVYGSQHRATFHYINVAPQWQTFNAGNWNQLEQDLRRYATSRHLDLDVYTGTHGVATLPDVGGVEKELWLYADENDNRAIPVPRLFWKVAYDPKTEEAIAFLGVNNPYVQKFDKSYILCKDVCDQVSGIKWDRFDVKKGYSYCCAVDEEFRAAIRNLPNFKVSGLINMSSRLKG